MVILFDEESRTFSAVEDTREFGDNNTKMNVLTHISGHRTPYAIAAGTVGGSVTGALIARKKAKKAGLTKGTKDYRRAIAKGAAIGAGAGAVTGYAAERVGTNVGTYVKTKRKMMQSEGITNRKDFMNMHGGNRKSMRKAIVNAAGYGKRHGRW